MGMGVGRGNVGDHADCEESMKYVCSELCARVYGIKCSFELWKRWCRNAVIMTDRIWHECAMRDQIIFVAKKLAANHFLR